MDFGQSYYWYRIIAVNEKYKTPYLVGGISGYLEPLISDNITGYDKQTGTFYIKCQMEYLGMNPPGLDEKGIREWIDKRVKEEDL